MADAKAKFPPPPGFEGYAGDIDEAELEALRAFLPAPVQRSSAAAPEAHAAVSAESDWRSLVDDRNLGKVPPPDGAARLRGIGAGLVGEASAQVEITPWKEDGAAYPHPEANLLDDAKSFEDLNLSENLLRGVYEMGFVKPSKIQAAALPLICTGQNMIGQAQNGSGKTATFSLALLSRLTIEETWPQALVLCTTRELAKQNESVISQLGAYLPVKTQLMIPGLDRVPKNPQCHVLIGTPGKVQDLAKKRIVDLSRVKVFVLDEADMMLDQENSMGPQVKTIRMLMPEDIQILFFSATYPEDVRKFAERLVPRALAIKVNKQDLTLSSVAQTYMLCENDNDKFDKLSALYGAMNVGQSVIFVNQRRKAFTLAKWMRDAGFPVSLICGTQTSGEERMDPALRDQVMDEFRTGVTRVLIATDVLARGIDVPQVTLVINYDLPTNYHDRTADMETYLHRVGRTGRFGLRGIAVNLVTESEKRYIDNICSYFECTIDETSDDFDALEERLKLLR
eukprot:TRINITY_DN64895_c0_g1_i1.p1 TRINITY_DN64895_c0_g1~~TRINITY_DN64895_c0_g1_i1.p1  ORF type:complete len:524 (+),score=90.49 TRINITY_DN64895_c0_g1_i1:45-1574(+)